jgi:hypothetical protein
MRGLRKGHKQSYHATKEIKFFVGSKFFTTQIHHIKSRVAKVGCYIFSLYPNPQKYQKVFSFDHSVLRDSDCLQLIILEREDLLEFSRKKSYERGM